VRCDSSVLNGAVRCDSSVLNGAVRCDSSANLSLPLIFSWL